MEEHLLWLRDVARVQLYPRLEAARAACLSSTEKQVRFAVDVNGSAKHWVVCTNDQWRRIRLEMVQGMDLHLHEFWGPVAHNLSNGTRAWVLLDLDTRAADEDATVFMRTCLEAEIARLKTYCQEKFRRPLVVTSSDGYSQTKDCWMVSSHLLLPVVCRVDQMRRWVHAFQDELRSNGMTFIAQSVDMQIYSSLTVRGVNQSKLEDAGARKKKLTHGWPERVDAGLVIPAEYPGDYVVSCAVPSNQGTSDIADSQAGTPKRARTQVERALNVEEIEDLGSCFVGQTMSYTEWVQMTFALISIGKQTSEMERMRRLFHKITAYDPNYDERHCDRKWQHMVDNFRGEVGPNSYFFRARTCNPVTFEAVRMRYNVIGEPSAREVAQSFYSIHGWLYVCSNNGAWYVVGPDGRWRTDAATTKARVILDVCDFCLRNVAVNDDWTGKQVERFRRDAGSPEFGAKVLRFLTALCEVPDFGSQLDNQWYYLGFENGVLDLRDRSFSAIDPEMHITRSVGYDYRIPTADDEADMAWVRKYFCDLVRDPGERDFLLDRLASSLGGLPWDEEAVFGVGPAGNGKDTLTLIMMQVLGGETNNGGYAAVLQKEAIEEMQRQSGAATSDLAALEGARFVAVTETNRFVLGRARFLGLVGAPQVSTRALYKEQRTIRVTWTLWVMCNWLPTLPGRQMDMALRRRWGGMPFRTEYRLIDDPSPELRFDPNNPNHCLRERQGITMEDIMPKRLAFLHALLARYQGVMENRGSRPPESVQTWLQREIDTIDPVGKFLRTRCVVDKTVDQSGNPLYVFPQARFQTLLYATMSQGDCGAVSQVMMEGRLAQMGCPVQMVPGWNLPVFVNLYVKTLDGLRRENPFAAASTSMASGQTTSGITWRVSTSGAGGSATNPEPAHSLHLPLPPAAALQPAVAQVGLARVTGSVPSTPPPPTDEDDEEQLFSQGAL